MRTADMLSTVRMSVHDLAVKNAAVESVLAEAEQHGWGRLVGAMSNDNRVKLITMLAEDNIATHAALEAVVGIYEQIIEEVVAAAEHDLDLVLPDRVECDQRRGNWLGLLAAGGVGYIVGRRAGDEA